jgi:N,N'-diacetyl-8-epilegionaminate cytidylyltransferase
MKVYAFVFARGGSKGLPQKNIMALDNKPLLGHSIDLAKNIKKVNKTFVSTEDPQIKKIAYKYNAEVIDRPIELSMDNSPEWLVWQHAVKYLEDRGDNFDIFLSLPTTAPLRNINDIERCLLALNDDSDIVITMSDSSRSPWFNMVKKEKDGSVSLLIKDHNKYINRQSTPKTYDMTTVAYVTTPNFIKNANNIFDGRVVGVEIPIERALDIDTNLDFKLANLLLKQTKEI